MVRTAQAELELDCIEEGRLKFRKNSRRNAETGFETANAYGRRLLSTSIEPVAAQIGQLVLDAEEGKVGANLAAAPTISRIDPAIAALIACKVLFDGISEKRSLQSVAVSIGNRIEDEINFSYFEHSQGPLHATVMRNLKRHPMGGMERVRRSTIKHAMKKFNVPITKLSLSERIKVGVALVDCAAKALGWFDIVLVPASQDRGRFRSGLMVVPTDECLQRINDYQDWAEAMFPIRLPMIMSPADWAPKQLGGYYLPGMSRGLVKVHSTRMKWNPSLVSEDMPEVYDAVNRIQSTPWRVNNRMLDAVRTLWVGGFTCPGMPPREREPKPAEPDFEKDPEAWKEWKRRAAGIFRQNIQDDSHRFQTARILAIADRFSGYEQIYFPMQLDFRGRLYPMPQFLNPQGNDLAKSLLEFGQGKPLGPEGQRWLAIHLANCFGNDKVSLQDRADWAMANSERIRKCAADPTDERWWTEADKPFQFLAACIEWSGFLKQGEDFISHLPILVDGSNNGTQLFSLASRDSESGRQVNLVPQPKPADIYQSVSDRVTEKLKEAAASKKRTKQAKADREFAKGWLAYGIDRKLCKRPTMVLPYGGTREACRKYIREHVDDRDVIAKKGVPFTHPSKPVLFLSRIMWAAMQEIVRGPLVTMDWIRACVKIVNKQKAKPTLTWIAPSGFRVQQGYLSFHNQIVKTKIGHKVTQFRVRGANDKLDTKKQVQAVSPNFVHSLDAAALMQTINRCFEKGITSFSAIHDSYGTLAADMPVLARTLREVVVEMFQQHDVLQELHASLQSLTSEPLPMPPPKGDLDITGVLKSDFFFA